MGRFLRTLLIGVGIGLLFAPKRGEETRQLLMQRFQGLTGSLAGNSSPSQSSTSSSTSPSSQATSSQETAESRQLKHLAESADQHSMMYTPPTTGNYEPAFPDYTNPEQK